MLPMFRARLLRIVSIALSSSALACSTDQHQTGSATVALLDEAAAPTESVHGTFDTERPLEQLTHTSWSIRDGLPQNSVHALLQSASGHIWIGTQEGLARFDGFDFRVFDRINTEGILNNHVTALAESSPDQIVAGTYGGGVYVFSGTHAASITTEDGLSSNTISAIALGPDGGLWIGTQSSGLNYVRGDSIVIFGTEEGLPDDRVTASLVEESGDVVVGTASGLVTISGATVDSSSWPLLADNEITALAQCPTGAIWAGTRSGLFHMDGHRVTRYTTNDGLPSDWIVSLYPTGIPGNVFIGSLEGLAHLRDGKFSTFRLEAGRAGNIISALLVTEGGILWLGTSTDGLHQLREATITTFSTSHGLATNIVYAVHGSRRGGIWIGSYYGDVDYFDGTRVRNVLPRSRMNTGRLRALHEDSDGSLWIGTEDGLHLYQSGRLTTFTDADGLPDAPVRLITEYHDGSIWVGTDGAGIFRLRNNRLVPWNRNAELPSLAVRVVHEDQSGRLWIGTYGGLCLLEDGTLRTYTVEDGLVHNQVRTIHESRDGTLWIGTYGGGLSRLRDGDFVNYTVADGLHNDAIYHILEDDDGNLWMSSNTGIFSVAASDLERFASGQLDSISSVVFNETDGMQNRECNGGSPGGYRAPSGTRLWFPTVGGLSAVNLGSLSRRTSAPVIIERLTVDNTELPLNGPHTLPPESRRLTLEFGALDYFAPEKTRYRYRLHGYDDEWVNSGGSRFAQYTSLRPGNYEFEVDASIREGVWTEEPATLRFHILPAYYQQWWFYTACIVSALLLAYGVYRRRLYTLRRNERILEAKVDAALERVKVLQGLLPICSYCKRIRDDSGYWNQLEEYVHQHSEAKFSHGLCPDCLQAHFPGLAEDRESD